MAEIISNNRETGRNKKRINKKSTRVDLTPMVDLGFLLITFFVFTTRLTMPTVMKVIMPDDKLVRDNEICTSCVLTVILDSNDRIRYYEGELSEKTQVKETSFSIGGIREILMQKKRKVKIARGSENEFVLIIKPYPESSFRNFVDILDEVAINNIKRYYIDDFADTDKRVIPNAKNGY